MLILNKIQTEFYPTIRARVIYTEGEFFPLLLGCCPKNITPRFVLKTVQAPKSARHIGTLQSNFNREFVNAAYTYLPRPAQPAPLDQDLIDLFMWGA